MGYKEDYRGVKDSFELIPAGKYIVRIKESVIGKTKDGTKPLWKLTLKIEQGKYTDRLMWMNLGLDADSISFRKGACTAMGLDTESGKIDLEIDPVGKQTIAEVFHDEYPKGSGNITAKVKRLRSMKPETIASVNAEEFNPNDDDLPF